MTDPDYDAWKTTPDFEDWEERECCDGCGEIRCECDREPDEPCWDDDGDCYGY